jgi:hypothetical protein
VLSANGWKIYRELPAQQTTVEIHIFAPARSLSFLPSAFRSSEFQLTQIKRSSAVP